MNVDLGFGCIICIGVCLVGEYLVGIMRIVVRSRVRWYKGVTGSNCDDYGFNDRVGENSREGVNARIVEVIERIVFWYIEG